MGRARPGPAPAGPHAGPHPRLLPPKGGESSRHGRTPPHAPSPAQDLACRVQTGVEQRRRGQDVQTAGARGAALAEPGWGRRRGGHAAPSQNRTPSWWPAAARPRAPTQPAAEGSQQRQWPADRPAASVLTAWALGRLPTSCPGCGLGATGGCPASVPSECISPTVFFSVFVCLLTHHPLSPKLIFLTSSHKGACRHRRGWGAEPRSQERGGGCFEDGREVDGWACAPSAGRGGAGGRQHARAVYGVGRDEGWVRHMLKRPAARTGKRCRAAPSMRVQGGGCVLLGRGTETRDGDGREHVSRPARQQENKKWGQEGGGRRAQRPVSARRAPRVPLSQSWSGRHSCPWRWRT